MSRKGVFRDATPSRNVAIRGADPQIGFDTVALGVPADHAGPRHRRLYVQRGPIFGRHWQFLRFTSAPGATARELARWWWRASSLLPASINFVVLAANVGLNDTFNRAGD